MSETITKLRPDRDLQCYFQMPSAVAALSQTSATGFTLSGCWRQQFDWAVIEWNRDNVFEHPQLRNLPDGDLSGIVLTYKETRNNCVPLDSTLSPTVDWPYLRIWADLPDPYKVPLFSYATPVSGVVNQASASFTLSGTVTPGDRIELAWDEECFSYLILGDDGDNTVDGAANRLAYLVTSTSSMMNATVSGSAIKLTIKSDVDATKGYAGANGNRLSAYGVVHGPGGTEFWTSPVQQFSGGSSTSTWKISLDFSQLAKDLSIPTQNIRLMRWTYAADLQPAAYQRSDFNVTVFEWSVTGTGLTYSVAGPGSRRIEDSSTAVVYSTSTIPHSTPAQIVPDWTAWPGNYSDGSIHSTTTPNATCSCQFVAEQTFDVYIGTRRGLNCASLTTSIDGVPMPAVNLLDGLEDFLVRVQAGTVQPGSHTLVIQHTGGTGTSLWLDFIELAVPTQQLPDFSSLPTTTLATDWDTLHSIALAPERTAWLINKLGFGGRANHYAGALWFYQLVRVGHVYATGTIQFGGSSSLGMVTTLSIGFAGSTTGPNLINHTHLTGDTPDTIAKAFELRINSGYTSVWASATSSTLTIQSRLMGSDGNNITIGIGVAQPGNDMTAVASSPQLTGGVNGEAGGVGDVLAALPYDDSNAKAAAVAYAAANLGWRTDLTAMPRINRAAWDWSKSFFTALKGYGIEVTAAFSTELQHGDPSTGTGIAQRYFDGAPTVVNTPALQTNFSPASLAFWQQCYADMAQIMADANQVPYLQFGEVQWWYFANVSGLPFYDDYTTSQFAAKYGSPMHTIASNTVEPAQYPQEAEFLPTLIGAFTRSIQQFVRQSQPATKFEVLYPCDTNAYPFTGVANFPISDWTATTLDCLKTENFSFTGSFNLELAKGAISFPMQIGFSPNKASHLVGISGPNTPWQKEANAASSAGLESVVLFALDQYCLIGYQTQSLRSAARSFMIP